ncbi:hypothetical protein [Candidatus Roseilinea sp. NK_OTU-006]|jgi:hypothetical protein|uniref:hypothetical protein n=1 Tax=Candidatus Roseilinea sp. NK_OTU-006 TaxID=2704250 RepID=UPI00145F7578|nr:hypothetical protein [Candidatus Roseilinea sp. NK_OTU-006]
MRPSTASGHAQRREQFLALAAQADEALETWYDQHPDAAFAEIEALRQALMGRGLEILINQRPHRADITQPRGADALCGVPYAGLPIGSGVVESGRKTVIQQHLIGGNGGTPQPCSPPYVNAQQSARRRNRSAPPAVTVTNLRYALSFNVGKLEQTPL